MIGIFDSGIGGITIFRKIIKKLPNCNYIYYSDSANNPYGDKNKEELIKCVNNVISFLINNNCKIIVIACNTASTIVNHFRKKYSNIIFIATEPAYKMVYDNNYNGKTLVMATKGTIESEKFLKLYHKYDNNNTILLPCVGLADLIENNKIDEIDDYLKEHLSIYKDISNVVLGCTHYPLIKDNISKVLGNVNFYDGSEGISKQLYRYVNELNIKGNGKIFFIDSANNKEKEKRFYNLLNL